MSSGEERVVGAATELPDKGAYSSTGATPDRSREGSVSATPDRLRQGSLSRTPEASLDSTPTRRVSGRRGSLGAAGERRLGAAANQSTPGATRASTLAPNKPAGKEIEMAQAHAAEPGAVKIHVIDESADGAAPKIVSC